MSYDKYDVIQVLHQSEFSVNVYFSVEIIKKYDAKPPL